MISIHPRTFVFSVLPCAILIGAGAAVLAHPGPILASSAPTTQPTETPTIASAAATAWTTPTQDTTALPPGHPAIAGHEQGMGAMESAGGLADGPQATIAWTAPAKWTRAPSTGSIRIATYEIAKVAGDHEDPVLAITRAGGATDPNVERWIAQFGPEASKTAKRSERTIAGLHVVLVEARGPYQGMSGGPEAGWMMLGAIVETPGLGHFFKLTGPERSVEAARADFDAMIGSVRPLATQ